MVTRAKKTSAQQKQHRQLLEALHELCLKLCEMNQKLDHLIKSRRKFYFTTDFSHSSPNGFKD